MQASQRLNNAAVDATHQGQHAADGQALRDAQSDGLGRQKLRHRAVPRQAPLTIGNKEFAGQYGIGRMQAECRWHRFDRNIGGCFAAFSRQRPGLRSCEQLDCVQQSRIGQALFKPGCRGSPRCAVLRVVLSGQTLTRQLIGLFAGFRPMRAAHRINHQFKHQWIGQQRFNMAALGLLPERVGVGHAVGPMPQQRADITFTQRLQAQFDQITARHHSAQRIGIHRSDPIGLATGQAEVGPPQFVQPSTNRVQRRVH